ncbi:MAG: hypothetical protein WA144_15400 [Candidatus Methanoperedens sp.]
MTAVDVDILVFGTILMSPIYLYLHKMSVNLAQLSMIVKNCSYCTRKNGLSNEQDTEE